MADEKKKPWQFSLKRALGAMTLICATLAASVSTWENLNLIDAISVAVFMLGLGSAIGALLGGAYGALIGATAGLFLFFAGCAVIALFLF